MMPDFKGSPATFLREVRSELGKVVWPTKNEVVKLTVVVLAVSIGVGIYIGGLDLVMAQFMNLLVKR